MEAYKPYIQYITNSEVAESGYILSRDGAILACSLPIKEMPIYNFDFEDEQGKITNILVDEKANLLEAIANEGVCKHKQGIRLYNQKYYTVSFENQSQDKPFITLYLKKKQGGACVCITKQLIVIGTFNSAAKMINNVPQNPGQLNKRVESLAKTLSSQGL